MERTKKTITVEIPVEFWAREDVKIPPLDNLSAFIYWQLTNYNDGRYPFSVEMFERGFTEVVKHSFIELVNKLCNIKFADERTPDGSLRSYIEAEKIWQKISVSIGDEDKIKVKME